MNKKTINTYHRERYRRLRAQGLCVKGGCDNPSAKGGTMAYCRRHQEEETARQRKEYRIRIAQGKCGVNGCAVPAQPNSTLCAKHAEKNRLKTLKHNRSRYDRGLCKVASCSKKRKTTSYYCDRHRLITNKKQRIAGAKRRKTQKMLQKASVLQSV